MLAIPPTSFHPINSQNTIFLKDAFWALLLPVTTLWREDDIFRGYWAQRLLWEIGGSLVIVGPTAYQLRNPHDFFLDYRMESNMYLNAEQMLKDLNRWTCFPAEDLAGCITAIMDHLHAKAFIGQQDVILSATWVADLKSLGYTFPQRNVPKRRFFDERTCTEPAKLPKSFTNAVEFYSKEELEFMFEPVECGTGDERGCIPSKA